eukprot:Hpha_TRINITY_DN14916_c0_g1::TRINITY_DN14916_c0_g1_i5::g.143060::m.143060
MRGPQLPPLEEWPQHPLLWRFGRLHPGPDKYRVLIMNTMEMIPFETDLFKGYVHVSARGHVPNSQGDFWVPGEMWHGRARRFVITFHGHFKKRIKMTELHCGMEWHRPLAPPRGIGAAAAVGSKFCPGLRLDVTHKTEPYLKNSLIGFLDTLHCWKPGDPEEERYTYEPGTRVKAVWERGSGGIPNFKNNKERMRGLNKRLPGGGTPLDDLYWETDWEYSFDFYTHVLHLDKFEVHVPLGFTTWPLNFRDQMYLGGNPFPICVHTTDGEYAFGFEWWHEAVLAKADPEVLPSAGGDALPSPLEKDLSHEGDELSFHSCAEADPEEADGGGYASSDEGDFVDLREQTRTPERTPDDRCATPFEFRDGLGSHVVQWKKKRIRTAPKQRAPWASMKGDISVGTPVRILETKAEWAYVQLPNLAKGWLRTRHLAPRDIMGGVADVEEPQTGSVTGKRKRLRAQPKERGKKMGAYLAPGDELYILTREGDWCLVLLGDRRAGWLKVANLRANDAASDDEA